MTPLRTNVLLVAALAFGASANAQVTTTWTYESVGSTTFMTNYFVRGSTFDGNGSLVVVGTFSIDPGTGSQMYPFVQQFHPDGSLWAGSALPSMQYFSAFGVAISPLDNSLYTATHNALQDAMTLTKLNSSGGFVWTTPVQGSVVNTAPQCLLDTAENLYVGITAFGPSRIALSSYTSSGAFRFTTPIGITSEVRALAMDSAGELILGGTGGATIAKISQAGVVQWATSTGFGTEIRRIACDASGNSYALIDGTRLQQFTASGAPGWNAMLPFSSAGNGYEDVAVDHQGAVIVTGHPLVASSPFVTRRYLANGNLLWERSWTAPGHTSSVPLFVEIDAAGNSVVSGRASVLVGATLVYDGAYASYTPAGDLRWSGLVSSGGRQINARALALDADSTFALVGEVMTVPTMGPALPQLHATHLRAQSIAFCFGDGSGAACPCGNVSPPGDQAGCTNAVGLAAHLADGGIASVTNDTLVLTSTNETPAGATLFIQGSSSIAPALFGDGLRCVGGSVKRLYTKVAVGGVVSAPQSGDASITARSAAQSDALVSGSTRFYQAYYRDPNSGFCPAPAGNTWNMSNGLIVTWAP